MGLTLVGANLSETSLCGASLSEANLRGANLNGADLRKADLRGVALSKDDMRRWRNFPWTERPSWADRVRWADLSGTDLRGAKLVGVNLSEVLLNNTKFREEDLDGVKYRPEQLKDMIIERPIYEPLIIPEQRGELTVQLSAEQPPLLHLLYLLAYLEYQYDVLYLYLFSQYDSLEALKKIFSGSPHHRLEGKGEAIRVVSLSTQSPHKLVLKVVYAVGALLCALFAVLSKEGRTDLYFCMRKTLFPTEEEKLNRELLQAKVLKENAEALKQCREVGEPPTDLLPPGEEGKPLPPALLRDRPQVYRLLEEQGRDLAQRTPRKDYLLMVLLLRQEGMLTNKLDNVALANLLEVLTEPMRREYESLCKKIGKWTTELVEKREKEGNEP